MNYPEMPPEQKGLFLTRSLPLETETCVFILVNALDLFMTYILLKNGNFVESNGLANSILENFDYRGVVYFKFGVVGVVVIVAQIMAIRRVNAARRLLKIGSLVVFGVVLYSTFLLFRYGNIL